MLDGFPSDFPKSFDARKMKNNLIGSSMFVRDENLEIEQVPIPKKPKVELEHVSNEADNENDLDFFKKVKFSDEPPVEYFTFNEKEYDRSPLNGHNKGRKRYLIQ